MAGRGREKQANSEEKGLFLVEKQAFSAGIEKFVSGCKKSKFLAGKILCPGGEIKGLIPGGKKTHQRLWNFRENKVSKLEFQIEETFPNRKATIWSR